jgi:hypothetical protein
MIDHVVDAKDSNVFEVEVRLIFLLQVNLNPFISKSEQEVIVAIIDVKFPSEKPQGRQTLFQLQGQLSSTRGR